MLTPEHAAFLAAHAVTPAVVVAHGIRSITTLTDLPEAFAWAGERAVPGILFPWRTLDGGTVDQLRPDVPVEVPGEKKPRKYLWPKDCGSVVGVGREDPDSDVVYFVEGTKQALVASVYAGPGSVYGIAGCRNWSSEGIPVTGLEVVEDRHVVLIFDADLASNLDVWTAAERFTLALNAEGAASVRYVLLPAAGTAGLDDLLGSRAPERRAPFLARLVDQAKTRLGGTGGIPKPKAKAADTADLGTADRPPVVVNNDRLAVIDGITAALRHRWDGRDLFAFGGVLARREGGRLEPVTPPQFVDLVQHAVTTVSVDPKGAQTYAEPTGTVMSAALARTWAYTPLERVALVPFVRPDGTICQAQGYDEATRTYLVDALPVAVPDEPTPDEVAAAVKLLRDEWLGDLMAGMPDDASRANTLATMLTPLVRGLVPVSPLAVVNGLQMGVGKNLVADLLAIFATGGTVLPLPWSGSDEENRKVISSAFRTGREVFVFDEAHVLEGAAMARALTASTYTDRILGVSTMAEFPNNVTWMSLGNNVQINGDMSRRVYVIRLAPSGTNPQDRSVDSFRHPDLKGWTAEHRAELVAAGLTLVRAWFVAGRPVSAAGRRFGSFEAWGGMVGGVREAAGVEGFLGNLQEWRSESDYEGRYWVDHLGWLAGQFGPGETFTVAAVVRKMKAGGDGVEHPPDLVDHAVTGYPRLLGKAYGRVKGRAYEGYRLELVRADASNGNRWALDRPSDSSGSDGGVSESGSAGRGREGIPLATYEENSPSTYVDTCVTTRGQKGSAHPVRSPDSPNAQVNPFAGPGLASPAPSPDPSADPEKRSHPHMTTTYRPEPGAIAWAPAPDPVDSPAAVLLPLARSTEPDRYGRCPDCETPLEVVEVSGSGWRACRGCTPATFVR